MMGSVHVGGVLERMKGNGLPYRRVLQSARERALGLLIVVVEDLLHLMMMMMVVVMMMITKVMVILKMMAKIIMRLSF